ncbi:MAG: M23 family metallopeptidase [Herbinix sp.]|nr:M23 family metallopeptidase [Herbinix sp.]
MTQKLIWPINAVKINCGYHNPNKFPVSTYQQCPNYKTLGSFAQGGHFGVDLLSFAGNTYLYGSGYGVVVGLNNNPKCTVGKWLAIKYANVEGNGDLIHRYYHLASINVDVGSLVNTDTLIGYYGNTGGYSTGAHLHLEVDKNVATWNSTPTITKDSYGLLPASRTSDTTINPVTVLYLKKAAPENQSAQYNSPGWYDGPKFMEL